MKTKNVRVRLKDIRAGKTIYIAHPFYGIEKVQVLSVPYLKSGIGFFFSCQEGQYLDCRSRSVDDAGISPGKPYNGRRTFFKLKHAEQYVARMSKDPATTEMHERHIMSSGWPD